ncbi:hypothetical protein FOA52_009095 [Chlamydomonas sp. UWO 241]|nr:hypothetical protein FOA52_009095 [Chlamydomonas sp. UWO 241]
MAATRNSHPGVVYKFTPKNRWDVKLHFFSGITAWPWVKFLVRHVTHIDWAVYWHRVLFLSIMAVINTLLAVPDWIMYRKRVDSQALHPEPVIILGHPRTGTTHLHNILSLDPAFAFCNTFHAGFPSSFVFLAPYRDLLSPMLAPTRPMDNMALHWDLPAEDEIATTVLSGGTSPYTSILLPREAARSFRDFFTFGRGSGGGGSSRGKRGGGGGGRVGGGSVPVPAPATASGAAALAARFDEWRGCLLWFLRKVTLAAALSDPSAASPKPLLIKSPVHTARVRLLRAEFPKARFLYIHRHPLHVFQSAAHMADAYYGYTYLQQPTDAAVTEYILNQYDVLYNEYISARGDVPKDRLHELSFDQLEDDPLSTLRAIYAKFGWLERFESLLPKFKAYCATLGDFKRNHHNTLSPEMAEMVRERWAPSFKEFGYS